MEDFLKFLLIAGVILVGIFKEVNKNSKSKKTQNNRPAPPMPSSSPVEVTPDAIPVPETWGKSETWERSKTLDELLKPIFEQSASKTDAKTTSKTAPKPAPKKQRMKEEISVSASLANSAAQDERNAKQGSHYASSEATENEEDFSIRSAEEARRAIIWGEILQRKY